MAVCDDCGQEMLTAAGCTVHVLIIQNERFERHRVPGRSGSGRRCGDCGAQPRGFHHVGCDMERCPRCAGQLLSCGCTWTDDDREALIAVADGIVVYPGGLRGLRVAPVRFPFGAPAEGASR